MKIRDTKKFNMIKIVLANKGISTDGLENHQIAAAAEIEGLNTSGVFALEDQATAKPKPRLPRTTDSAPTAQDSGLGSILDKVIKATVLAALDGHQQPLDEDHIIRLIRAYSSTDEDKIRQMIEDYSTPQGIAITVNDEVIQTSTDYHHKQFKQVLTSLLTREPVYLYGTASGGKTTMYKQLAASLTALHNTDIPLITSVQLFTQFEITGYKDANGKMVSTIFRTWFENGGLLAIDEFDRSMAKALTALNQMIENRFFTFPDNDTPQQMHENCYFIASGNTALNGNGSTAYSAAEAIDSATRDRFIAIEFEFDRHIEELMAAGNKLWLAQVRKIRNAVKELGIGIIVSTRPIRQGAKLLEQGMPLGDVIRMTIFKGLDNEQAVKILHTAGVEV